MATQGLVTIRKGNKVVMKIVAGSDGMKAPLLSHELRLHGRVPTINQAYKLAEKVGFGSKTTLVVLTGKSSRFDGDGDLPPLYRETFEDPEFNPRWVHGIADYTDIIDF